MGNALKELGALGQSVWLDYVSRDLMASGGLARYIAEDGITGVTSNPSIFQKALKGSAAYDGSLRAALRGGVREPREIFFRVAVEDIGRAADELRPVYDATGGRDGFVSIEVSPDLADRTDETIAEARRLFGALARPNVLIKVPGTRAGLPAIETLIAEGVNVNVTLLFGVGRYGEVMEAFLRGMEKRGASGLPVEGIASVASFFVSRVDTLVDTLLKEKGADGGLVGKMAVANAQLAYRAYREVMGGARFKALAGRGAHEQRILWASTGTKDPAYSDIKYVEELIAPGSVNTMPEQTIGAFRDHGAARVTIGDGAGEADGLFARLAAAGVDMGAATERLEREGVKLFADSFFALLADIEAKILLVR
jgi:transaldolase